MHFCSPKSAVSIHNIYIYHLFNYIWIYKTEEISKENDWWENQLERCANMAGRISIVIHTHTHTYQGGLPGRCCCWPLPLWPLTFDLTTVCNPHGCLHLIGCRRPQGWTVVGQFRKGGGRKSQVQKIYIHETKRFKNNNNNDREKRIWPIMWDGMLTSSALWEM